MRSVILGLLLPVFAAPAFAGDAVSERIKRRGEVYMGLEGVYDTPNVLAYQDLKSGEFKGLEIDLAREIAAELGAKLVIVPTKWDRLPEAVRSDKIDFALQQIFIPAAADVPKTDAYSKPYLHTGHGLACRKQVPCTLEAARSGKLKVAAFNDPTTLSLMKGWGLGGARTFDVEKPMYDALIAGRIDMLVYDYPLLVALVGAHDKALALRDGILPGSDADYGVLVRADAPALRAAVDRAIDRWRGLPATRAALERHHLLFKGD